MVCCILSDKKQPGVCTHNTVLLKHMYGTCGVMYRVEDLLASGDHVEDLLASGEHILCP
jgi:hypothetical protein